MVAYICKLPTPIVTDKTKTQLRYFTTERGTPSGSLPTDQYPSNLNDFGVATRESTTPLVIYIYIYILSRYII